MAAKSINSFAAGLIVASGVCGAVYFYGPSEATETITKTVVDTPTEEEMKTSLASTGYVISTEEEWKEMLAAVEAVEPETNKEQTEEEEGKETVIYRTILTVSSGMTSIDVGNALVKANIIDNAMDFFHDVEKRGLSNKLRPGSYELDSKMTIDEVMSTIFK